MWMLCSISQPNALIQLAGSHACWKKKATGNVKEKSNWKCERKKQVEMWKKKASGNVKEKDKAESSKSIAL